MSALTLDLPADVLARVQAEARRDGATIAEFVENAIRANLRVRVPMAERRGRQYLLVCRGCNKERLHHARGYCKTCDAWQRAQVAPSARPIVHCAACQEDRPHFGHGLCGRCYARYRRSKGRWCRGCHSYQQEFATGLCSACYQRSRRAAQRGAA